MTKKRLSPAETVELLDELKKRFEKNVSRHKGLEWTDVAARLESRPDKLWSLSEMERTGGEPDVVVLHKLDDVVFLDCSVESPKGRRSVCFDHRALESRKEHKPGHSAVGMASEMGIDLLSEEEYRALQECGEFDLKTSSWVATPSEIRKLGGAMFCDRRYETIWTYHNGAESYYAARGFRGSLKV
ncbi:MAG: DUF4256 domain-containing protein [Pyrinomonadaceae bacterium]